MLLTFFKEALYFNLLQLHRLVTHEDAIYFHLHKTLGASVLGHFAYRIYNFTKHGEMGFDGSWKTLLFIFVHAALHMSSFEFVLPSRRNKVYNVIWPEMRWHSMIFAYRSVVLMFLIWMGMNSYVSPHAIAYIRGPFVIATMLCADYVTAYYKRTDKLEASDSTMRGNPYPQYVNRHAITIHNTFYSLSQVLATANILYRGFNEVFLQLLAIQTAPFGMTLVKKGILKQAGWHWTYTLAILTSYLYGALTPSEATQRVYWFSVLAFCVARFRFNVNKYALWSTAIAVQWYIMYSNDEMYNNIVYHSTTSLVWKPSTNQDQTYSLIQ